MTGQAGVRVGLEVTGQAEAAVGGDRDVGDHQVGQAGLGDDQGVVAVGGLEERHLLAGYLQAFQGQAEAVAEAWSSATSRISITGAPVLLGAASSR